MPNFTVVAPSSAGGEIIPQANTPAVQAMLPAVEAAGRRRLPPASKTIVEAVLSYVRAVRSLDRTTLTSEQIASALSLSEDVVLIALQSLSSKGVKLKK